MRSSQGDERQVGRGGADVVNISNRARAAKHGRPRRRCKRRIRLMRWLVTGASGQLGGYLLRHLRDRGEEVVAWSGTVRGEVCGVPLEIVDLTDTASMPVPFHDARPEAVIHAAAMARVD